MEQGVHDPEVVDDDNRGAEVGRQQVAQQARVGVEAPGPAADADHREVIGYPAGSIVDHPA